MSLRGHGTRFVDDVLLEEVGSEGGGGRGGLLDGGLVDHDVESHFFRAIEGARETVNLDLRRYRLRVPSSEALRRPKAVEAIG